ncbi:MAG: DUF2752 domain-containing protein [Bacteroidia bacterium]|nr:DUF2752 domain-containing protein [Bacteroidia bacterium]
MQKRLQWLWLIALGLAPIVLWILPGDFFDHSEVELCPSKAFFNIECLGCGMTRAVMHMHHLEIDSAAYYNPGVFVVFPGLVLLWGYWVWMAMGRLDLQQYILRLMPRRA